MAEPLINRFKRSIHKDVHNCLLRIISMKSLSDYDHHNISVCLGIETPTKANYTSRPRDRFTVRK